MDWGRFTRIAIPGMLMVCLEWWGFEIGVFLSGLLGTTDLGAQSVVLQIDSIWFQVSYTVKPEMNGQVSYTVKPEMNGQVSYTVKPGMNGQVSYTVKPGMNGQVSYTVDRSVDGHLYTGSHLWCVHTAQHRNK